MNKNDKNNAKKLLVRIHNLLISHHVSVEDVSMQMLRNVISYGNLDVENLTVKNFEVDKHNFYKEENDDDILNMRGA